MPRLRGRLSDVRRAFFAFFWLAWVSTAVAAPADLIGGAAPSVRARALDGGGEVSLDDHRDRPVVLAFVASWCGSCRRIAPALRALAERHASEGLVLLALSHEPRARLRRHAPEMGLPLFQCTGRTAVSYEADAVPTLVLIDRARTVRFAGSGASALRGLRASLARVLER
ncbi:MAG: TlpA disulfide reductase family protein [Sandaracinaceae bacterium]